MIKIVTFSLLAALAIGLPDRPSYSKPRRFPGFPQKGGQGSREIYRSFGSIFDSSGESGNGFDSRESRRGDSRESRRGFSSRGFEGRSFDSRESGRHGSSRESFGYGGKDSREFSKGKENSRESFSYKQPEYSEEDRSYEFEYGVKHPYDNLHFGHKEEKSDGKVEGYYYVLLPDTRIQHVKYTADAESGYVAEVTYEGSAEFDSHEQEKYYGRSEEKYEEPQREYRKPEREYRKQESREYREPEREPEREYRKPEREYREPEREPEREYRKPEREYREPEREPEREYRKPESREYREPEREPEREYRKPEREYQRPSQSYRAPEESREQFGPRY